MLLLPRVENLLPWPRGSSESTITSFFDSQQPQVLPLVFSLNSLCSNWNDHQALNINLNLDNLKYVWRQTLLDLTRNSYTQHINNLKTWLGFFLLYLRQNIKPDTSYGLGLELENSTEKHSTWTSIDRV